MTKWLNEWAFWTKPMSKWSTILKLMHCCSGPEQKTQDCSNWWSWYCESYIVIKSPVCNWQYEWASSKIMVMIKCGTYTTGLPHIDKQKSSKISQHKIGKSAHTSQMLTTAQFVLQVVSAWTAIPHNNNILSQFVAAKVFQY